MNASVTYTAVATVDPAASGTLVNVATVVPGGVGGPRVGDPDPTNNTATDIDIIEQPLFADGFESGDTSGWDDTVF